MELRRRSVLVVAIILLLLAGAGVLLMRCGYVAGIAPTAIAGGSPQYDEIELPPGFTVHAYAAADGARSMSLGPEGILFVGSRGPGNVYAVIDEDGDYRGETVKVIASGMNSPNGVAYRDGDLYVAEISRVVRFDDIVGRLDDPPEPVVVNDGFPSETHHGWKFIRFSPDGMLYVPVGAPCNVCEREDERFASIMRMQPDGTGLEVFAHGVRNTVGFDWNPETGVLWFTDNGRDWMGDHHPPDELNRAPRPGMHFGFPYCHGRTPDPELTEGPSCEETVAPVADFVPHVAALGMRFYEAEQFPSRYRGGVFVAQHGSWNRTDPVGYRVVFVPVEGTQAGEVEPFAEGWLGGTGAWGRPVDVAVAWDGSLLVSDDKAGLVHRIHYAGN